MKSIVERLITPLEHLTSPLNPDAFLSTINPLWGTRLRGVIDSVIPMTDSAASIRIRPGRLWRQHVPGQFTTIGVDVDGVRHHRCFSLTSVPDAPGGLIEITVESSIGGLVSTHLVTRARAGDVVQLTQPEGTFTLPSTGDKMLFLTGGSGITPITSMLRSMTAQGNGCLHDVVLLHHARSAERSIFYDEIRAITDRFEWIRVVNSFTANGGSRLSADRIDTECPDWRDRQVYVCGPNPLTDFVERHWSDVGLLDRVHVENFVPALPRRGDLGGGEETTRSSAVTTAPNSGSTRFTTSKLQVPTRPGVPLLDVAESAGLAPAHGCRMGICHTCTTYLEDGCVTDLRDGRISEAGSHIQICVSSAMTDVSLDL